MSGFFESLCEPLVQQAASYASTISQQCVSAILPVMVSAHVVGVFFYGLAIVRGDAQQPVMAFVWKTFKFMLIAAVVAGYTSSDFSIVKLAWSLQDDLVHVISGYPSAFAAIDSATLPCIAFIQGLLIFMIANTTEGTADGFFMAGLILCFVIFGGGALALALFYALLCKVGLGIVIGVGPLFVAALAFGPLSRFFDLWLSTLLNFCLLAAVSTVMMTFVTSANGLAIAAGGPNILKTALLLILFGVVLLLLMMEVPRLTSGLTSGVDITGTISSYAGMKVAYSQPWMESFNPARNRLGGDSSKQESAAASPQPDPSRSARARAAAAAGR